MSITILGFVAGAMTTIAFLPQVIKTLRLKETKDISLGFCFLNSLAGTAWLIYGILIGSLPLMVNVSIALALGLALLFLKLKYKSPVENKETIL